MRFVLIDLTNGATTADGGQLTHSALTAFADAITIQLNRDFSAEWGGDFSMRVGAGAGDLQGDEIPFAFLPTLADAPGAIAFHNSNGNGQPLLFDGISLSQSLTGPGNTASVAASHECLETAQDSGCNVWCDTGTGTTQVAQEMCDAFENQSYAISLSDGTQVWVSDFARRAFFIPGARGPYCYTAAAGIPGNADAPAPMVTPPGVGYQITRRFDPSSEQAVNGVVTVPVGVLRRRPMAAQGARKHTRGLRL
jgi:hypothetical protein